jgi:hypothetical protein
MSNSDTPVILYSRGDIIRVDGYSPITITQVIVSGRQIGYAGTYTANGNNIQMELSWIPQKLIKGIAVH